MPFLSPAKILVILVVALIVLGPEKLPKVARQFGSLWNDFRLFRERMEHEVRSSFPDLPSTETITHAVRSPITFLDGLADAQTQTGAPASVVVAEGDAPATGVHDGTETWTAAAPDATGAPAPSVAATSNGNGHVPGGAGITAPGQVAHVVRPSVVTAPDDPSLN